jgi:hypothetical protein
MVTVEDVRAVASSLPRTSEHLIRDRVKFRIGRIVYLAFSRDEQFMGLAFPKEEREALVAAEPEKFVMPSGTDMRYNWVVVRLASISLDEMRELVADAWRMCVPKHVAREHLDGQNSPSMEAADQLASGTRAAPLEYRRGHQPDHRGGR